MCICRCRLLVKLVLPKLKPGRTARRHVVTLPAPRTVFTLFKACALGEVKETPTSKSVEVDLAKALAVIFIPGGWSSFPHQAYGVQIPGMPKKEMVVRTMHAKSMAPRPPSKVPSLRMTFTYEVMG